MRKKYNKEELDKLLIEYSNNKTLELRNKIIIMTYPLVQYFAYIYGRRNNVEQRELYSYGVEGLIKSIDKFDINLGSFISYASLRIIREIKTGIAEIKGYSINSYWRLLQDTISIQKENNKFLNENENYIVDLVEELKKENKITNAVAFNMINKNYVNYPESLDDEENDYSHLKVIDPVLIIEEKDIVENILNSLTKEEKKLIEMRFGFKDGKVYSLREIEKMEDVNITREGLRLKEAKILRKIRKEFK